MSSSVFKQIWFGNVYILSARLEFLSLLRKDLWTNFFTVNHCHCRRKNCHIKPYLSSFFTLEIIIDCNCFFIIYLPHKSLSIKTVPFFIICYINHTWFWSCFFSLFAAEIIFNSNCTFLFYLLRKALSNCAVLFLLFAAGIIVKLNRTILLNLPRDSLSNQALFFFLFVVLCRGNHCQIVPYGSFLLYSLQNF